MLGKTLYVHGLREREKGKLHGRGSRRVQYYFDVVGGDESKYETNCFTYIAASHSVEMCWLAYESNAVWVLNGIVVLNVKADIHPTRTTPIIQHRYL